MDITARPLVVDLDGTLVKSDLLIETAFSELGQRPHSLFDMARALCSGKAALKHRLSEPRDFDPAVLPYDGEVLEYIKKARCEGRPVYIASASHEYLVRRVADHLGLFTGWFATDAATNCAGEIKAQKLVDAFGERNFDYIGNDMADLPVWQKAASAVAIRTPAGVLRKLGRTCPVVERLASDRPTLKSWAKQARVHQYAKNALVFVPLVTGHVFELHAFFLAFLAAVAFSLCASGVYILNDLVDLQDDRRHSTKSHRPLANGTIPLSHGLLAIPLLLTAAVSLAALISLPFMGVLIGYFALTTAYSLFLKRQMLVDVITLAALYTARVVGGAVALNTGVSVWLLAFFMAWFLSLALIKRYIELAGRREAKLPDITSRDYKNSDIEMVAALAAAMGFNAVTVFVLYVSSDTVDQLYSRPEILWLIGPVLIYWIARALMLARRGLMHDDPVVFALKDRASLASVAIIIALVVIAM
ncbi:UbiA family prenyltransferase [Pseudaminobacter sp. NGMCC 1.201702]|uniref:UbiA family prenyltransferase n=1 Tax=Pseudaminobacter sp. NGMCC 1.201702 TaxID=3391825 RepID=UPI0039EF881E